MRHAQEGKAIAGELWLQKFQLGKETVAGTPVPATRIIYANGSIKPVYAVNLVEVATGTRDNQRDAHTKSVVVAGSITHPLAADETLEYFLMGLKSGVTAVAQAATTPTVQPATFTNATSGGTIGTGVISARYTVVYPAGESQALNVVATTTTTTSASTVTIGAVTPLPAGATGVRYFITAPGGAVGTASYAGTNATGASITLTAPGDGTTLPPVTTPTAVQTYTFINGAALDSGTLEWFDGQRNWQASGVRVNQIGVAGKVDGENILSVDLFGVGEIVNAATGSLVDRTPDYFEGWEAKLYLDAFGGVAGTTNIPGTMLSWDVKINNNLARKYFADNTRNTGAVTIGKLDVTVDITMEANSYALTEYNNWVAGTKRLARLEFGNNVAVGTGTAKKKVMFDIPLAWTNVDIGVDDANTRAYKFTGAYVTDLTNAYAVQATVVGTRATTY